MATILQFSLYTSVTPFAMCFLGGSFCQEVKFISPPLESRLAFCLALIFTLQWNFAGEWCASSEASKAWQSLYSLGPYAVAKLG